MKKFAGIVIALTVTAACGATNSPTAPTAQATSTTATAGTTDAAPVWPVHLPNGAEDPGVPPPSCACPAGFSVHYNGGNFICRKPGGAAYEVVLPDLAVKTCGTK